MLREFEPGNKIEMLPFGQIDHGRLIREAFAADLASMKQRNPTHFSHTVNSLPRRSLVQPTDTFQAVAVRGKILESIALRWGHSHFIERYRQKIKLETGNEEELVVAIADSLHPQAIAVGINLLNAPLVTVGDEEAIDTYMRRDVDVLKDTWIKPLGTRVARRAEELYGRTVRASAVEAAVCLAFTRTNANGQGVEDNSLILGDNYRLGVRMDLRTVSNIHMENWRFEDTEHGSKLPSDVRRRFETKATIPYMLDEFNRITRNAGFGQIHVRDYSTLKLIALADFGPASTLAQTLIEQSAQWVAAQIAAVHSFKGNPDRLPFIIEGELILDEDYRKRVELCLLNDHELGRGTVTFTDVEDGALTGAAAILTPPDHHTPLTFTKPKK